MQETQTVKIDEALYRRYFYYLLRGDRQACLDIVKGLLGRPIKIRDLFIDLFQRSLYEIGTLWEYNKISVAVEHLATSITESLMSLTYPIIFSSQKIGKKAVISCIANEHHQIGGRMVADIFELHGWDGYFLGANTPLKDLLELISEKRPQIVGLSLSVFSNLSRLIEAVKGLNVNFPDLPIIVGGQAFLHCNEECTELFRLKNVTYIDSLNSLEQQIIGVK